MFRTSATIFALTLSVAAGAYALGWFAPDVAEADAPCVARAFEGDDFTVCLYDAKRHDIALEWADASGAPYRTFEAYERERGGQGVRFAMNAGMFDPAGAPVGLYVSNGKTARALQTGTGKGNFFLKPNGVFFATDDAVAVTTTEDFVAKNPNVRFATQSGPMLVIAGRLHPSFQGDGPSRYIRNGVGIRDPKTAVFVISEDEVSFGKFARFFRDVLHCKDALYFDGAVSSLWVSAQGRRDADHQFGPMVVVHDRAPAR